MERTLKNARLKKWNRWRAAAWSAAALLLLVPLIAMQFTDEVNWELSDFIVAAALIGGTGLTFELAIRKSGNGAYRAGVGVALAAGFLLIWVNGAVGIIGNESNPLNLMFSGVLAVGLVGALIARFQPPGMARALVATALTQVLVALIALIAGYFTLVLNGFFVALWLISARLFQNAGLEISEPSAH